MAQNIACAALSASLLAACAPPAGPVGSGEPPSGEDAGLQPGPPDLFSHSHGFYTEPFELVLTSPVEGGELYYTLDGRDPLGPRALAYTGPVPIRSTGVVRAAVLLDGAPAMATRTQSYIFAEHIPQQRDPGDYPAQWWVNDETGPYQADYAMDPEIVDDARYRARFPGVFHALSVVSVAMDPDDLFGPLGIHENPEARGAFWERPASAEIFDSAGDDSFQINCGIRVQGAGGRMPERSPKKSFRLLFKSNYGLSKLEYRVFPGAPVQKFDNLVLRARYNRSWGHHAANQRIRAQYMRERFAADTQRAMGHVSPRGRHVHLFLNGLYWGVYLLQERPDASFQAAHFGGDKDEYDAINANNPVDGDLVAWQEMMTLAEGGLESTSAYAEMQQWVDIDNFIDYMLLNMYLGNVDWPDRNWYAARHRSPGSVFRFFNWDAELTIRSEDDNFIDVDSADSPGRLFQKLRASPEFRTRVSERIALHLTGDGALTPSALIERWANITGAVEPAIVAESARWGDYYRDVRNDPEGELYTYDGHWLPENRRIRERYLSVRRDIALQQFIDAGLYSAEAP